MILQKKQLREEDTIIVIFKGEILEVSPARFAQVIEIRKESEFWPVTFGCFFIRKH